VAGDVEVVVHEAKVLLAERGGVDLDENSFSVEGGDRDARDGPIPRCNRGFKRDRAQGVHFGTQFGLLQQILGVDCLRHSRPHGGCKSLRRAAARQEDGPVLHRWLFGPFFPRLGTNEILVECAVLLRRCDRQTPAIGGGNVGVCVCVPERRSWMGVLNEPLMHRAVENSDSREWLVCECVLVCINGVVALKASDGGWNAKLQTLIKQTSGAAVVFCPNAFLMDTRCGEFDNNVLFWCDVPVVPKNGLKQGREDIHVKLECTF
jgi:hypothetical protein